MGGLADVRIAGVIIRPGRLLNPAQPFAGKRVGALHGLGNGQGLVVVRHQRNLVRHGIADGPHDLDICSGIFIAKPHFHGTEARLNQLACLTPHPVHVHNAQARTIVGWNGL